jgi:hypothetical protein
MSLRDLWKLAGKNSAILVDSRGRATVDRSKFVANKNVRSTVVSLRTRRPSESLRREERITAK